LTAGDHVGTEQADDYKAHAHKVGAVAGEAGSDTGRTPAEGTTLNTTTMPATGGNETRPKNRAYMPLIKY
jgi:hypothetical protein